jgi:hypothetical protein
VPQRSLFCELATSAHRVVATIFLSCSGLQCTADLPSVLLMHVQHSLEAKRMQKLTDIAPRNITLVLLTAQVTVTTAKLISQKKKH